ncbi:MAG: nodulation protein NolNO [Thermodesulfobacteriota bacterium]|nr:MAG: nodulation protein NolNO [Thermodesulfobacteriota bacterium]
MNIIGISGLNNSVLFKKTMFPDLEKGYYRIAQGFDSAAALVSEEGVISAVAEERFNREKATNLFPINAIEYCLNSKNISLDNIDFIAHGFDYEPFRDLYLKDEYLEKQFSQVYSKEALIKVLEQNLPSSNMSEKLVQVPHHIAHAASAFYPSGFDESLILVSDGMGEVHSATIAIGSGNEIEIIEQIPALHSLGILYGVFTIYLGFQMGMDEYKVMGLAPYGDRRKYFAKIMDFINLKDNGTYTIPLLFLNETNEDKETYRRTLDSLVNIFGPKRENDSEITQDHMDIAAGLQAALESSLMHVLRYFKKETGQKNLCMAGGVALNCTANGLIKRSRIFKDIFIQPAAGDDGTAVGAGLYIVNQKSSRPYHKKMALPYWGPEYENDDIMHLLNKEVGIEYKHYESFKELAKRLAEYINQGKIVGYFQERMEFGPRALGNRSILADPRDPEMRDRVNSLIKKREGFRPFAPAVIEEEANTYFEIAKGDEDIYSYMLFVTRVRENFRKNLPAITHVDGSARVQTVCKEKNQRFWTVINEFGKISGIPIILNTSFNVKGQPIVCSPSEAIETFLFAGLDLLVLGNFLILRNNI